MLATMKEIINRLLPEYKKIRHQLHQYPELRYEEVNTAHLIAQTLRNIGLTPQMKVGKTGVVAVLDSGKSGKTIALRADMDALPIVEETHIAYRSRNEGVMHACGHDGHVATLLACAHVLYEMRHTLKGKIKFIFQPAEEGGAGALAMINDGVLENPTVDAIFGYHNYPGISVGKIQAKSGCTMYGNIEFAIQVHGKGGHAAMPEWAINPITISAELINELNSAAQKLSEQEELTVLSITNIHSGKATNVIPEMAIIKGTIRAPSEKASEKAQKILMEHLTKVNDKYQTQSTITFDGIYPATINSDLETAFVLDLAKSLFGENQVVIKPKSSRASEDFSFFLQNVPGCYFFIGNGENSASCHNPTYNFNDAILPVAIEMLCNIALKAT